MQANRKQIVMSGYFGFDNAGDEAICAAIIQTLRQMDQDVQITVLSGNPAKTASTLDVQAIDRWDLRQIWKTLKTADLFISGGGSLLQDKTGKLTIPYYLGLIHLARLAKVPVAIYAQGIGPVEGRFFQKWIAYLFKKLAYVSVRDPASKQLLLDWGLPEQAIEEVVDPVFLLESSGQAYGQQLLAEEGIALDPEPIIVSVRYWQESKEDFITLAALCDRLIEAGEQIVFLPLHDPEDVKASCEVLSYMQQKAHVLQGHYTPAQMLDIISASKTVLAMRLHALIFAAARNVPCVGLSYDPKIDAFLALVGQQPAAYTGNFSLENVWQKMQQVLAEEQVIRQDIEQRQALLQRGAQQPAAQVLALLTNTDRTQRVGGL